MQFSAFRYQYRISKQAPAPHPGATTACRALVLDGWTLELGADLPLAQLCRADGTLFGLLFGIAVDGDGGLIVDSTGQSPDPRLGWDPVEHWIEGISGRFGVLLSDGTGVRFYSDACGMIGAVYDAATGRLASSLGLCLDRPVEDHEDYDHAAVAERGALYTLFDTRDKTARRVNPSCYLSLDSFSETRFWPRAHSISLVNDDLSATYDWLIAHTEQVTGAIAKAHRTWLALSGGQDSRLLLAMAGPAVQHIESSFTHVSNFVNRIDASIAGLLAEQVGVPHQVHDKRLHKPAPDGVRDDTAAFLRGLGFEMPPQREITNGLIRLLPDGAVVLRGHQTDILRAVLADRVGPKARKRSRWQIKRLLPVPRAEFDDALHQRFHDRYETWRSALPAFAEANSTDLMFLEIYYSSTVGCTFPAHPRVFYMSPFNGRRQIGCAMAMDETYRKSSYPVFDIIARSNPGLERLPFDFELGPDLSKLTCETHMQQVVEPRLTTTAQRMPAMA
ncbi:hypothetical protein EEB11_01450 [Pseudotabrizicola sediminis]|uniref:Asparagine synthase n=1 Tax=Pseudotabrizicola sediminis TaxID=2486418 RepID=A0ABY2KSQ0_9RHOB|nr:hypothetical protein [Pseudotabrizicola sediminis]TGD45253.1 hypothetical protein EEB11_01450 [Pseudotabrizicola sediminis]